MTDNRNNEDFVSENHQDFSGSDIDISVSQEPAPEAVHDPSADWNILQNPASADRTEQTENRTGFTADTPESRTEQRDIPAPRTEHSESAAASAELFSSEPRTESVEQTLCRRFSPLEEWVAVNPSVRQEEVEYLASYNRNFPPTVAENGSLQKAVIFNQMMFLIIFDKMFPNRTENNEIPVSIYLAAPNASELRNKYGIQDVPNVSRVNKADRLELDKITRFIEAYEANRYQNSLITEVVVNAIQEWIGNLAQYVAEVNNQRKAKQKDRRNGQIKSPSVALEWVVNAFTGEKRDAEKDNPAYYESNRIYHDTGANRRAKYIDARGRAEMSPRCKKVVLSNRAYTQIFSETYSKIRTETGGLLLGHFENNVWYVVEASDPGINATFTVSYHEGDDAYENHVCGVYSRLYKHPLVFLGMWHRHPGSLDTFSGTDDQTNYKYANSAGNGCISALVNIDPSFRLTFYYVEQGNYRNSVYYTKVGIEVGDDKFRNPEILKLADPADILNRRH